MGRQQHFVSNRLALEQPVCPFCSRPISARFWYGRRWLFTEPFQAVHCSVTQPSICQIQSIQLRFAPTAVWFTSNYLLNPRRHECTHVQLSSSLLPASRPFPLLYLLFTLFSTPFFTIGKTKPKIGGRGAEGVNGYDQSVIAHNLVPPPTAGVALGGRGF